MSASCVLVDDATYPMGVSFAPPIYLAGRGAPGGRSVEDMTQKTWFITGTSRGFGREWAAAALERGDRVAGTARDTSTLDELVSTYGDAFLPIELDVTDRAADVAAVGQAHERFGRLDVVVNNAGYGHFGFVEEVTEDEARAQLETNLFGALWVTQAALPFLREQGSGHIVQVSSIGGISAFPGVGLYHASKWGLEGFSQALAQEVARFGIHVTLVEPGGFATDWAGPSAKRSQPLEAYAQAREDMERQRQERVGAGGPGDPTASAKAILRVVDADEPPLRVFFGAAPIDIAKADYAQRIETWERWDDVAKLAQG
ncbi:NADP-dependent 3-hydroxy acid dehydrogenase YdfG [Lapillicoccus jejuensis]|uniref:NADP-dependent 3-hydroxy acid dehydrogenase YdfG n=2 Tax=Lapillicoccus jejuensis TaxID=402171 RepID=A0A542E0C4_9MICO|nr:NADP-dependent 3-hydroxy acid dehydrogenase YdfG [Lapillicoccus jejuensis]